MRSILKLFMMMGIFLMFNSIGSAAEKQTDQLMQVDRDFSQMAQDKGIGVAFDYFMDNNARMIKSGMNVVVGREAINAMYGEMGDNESLVWEPDFAEISESEDLGYTIGHYTYTLTDSTGSVKIYKGNYVTIWKKQPDGSWKYVFDTGSSGPKEK